MDKASLRPSGGESGVSSVELLRDFISVAEAARGKHCTVQAIRMAIKRGVLTAEKIGRTWVIFRDSYAQYTPIVRPRRGMN